MNSQVALCLDTETAKNPEIIGLKDENILEQSWLKVFNDACQARKAFVQDPFLSEAWVVSSDSVEGINLAAALKHDEGLKKVYLLSFDRSGSVASRCKAAGIEMLNKSDFLKSYAHQKEAYSRARLPKVSSTSWGKDGFVPVKAEDLAMDQIILDEPLSSASSKTPLLPQRLAFEDKKGKPHIFTESKLEKIARANLNRTEVQHASFVMTIVSGSGGSGKSSVALMGSLASCEMGYKTLLIDGDLQFGDLKFLMGADNSLDITDVLAHPERLESLEVPEGFPAFIASPQKLEHSEVVIDKMAEFINYARAYFEVIVVNTGAFWSEQHAQLLESSDKVLFLLDQRPSSIRSCAHALDLCSRCGIATQSFLFVLNFCSRQALFTSMDVSCTLQGAAVRELKDGGKDVGELLAAGLPRELVSTKNAFYESLYELLEEIIPLPKGAAAPKRTLNKRSGLSFILRKKRAACL